MIRNLGCILFVLVSKERAREMTEAVLLEKDLSVLSELRFGTELFAQKTENHFSSAAQGNRSQVQQHISR